MVSNYKTESEKDIQQLIKDHLSLVKKISWQIFGKVSNVVEIEDVMME